MRTTCVRPLAEHACPPLAFLAVNAHVQQRTGSAMITACCAYWDKTTDGYASTKWESESVQVLVTVFGIAV